MGLTAGGTTEVEVAGRHDQISTLIDQFDRRIAHGHRVRFAIDIDELDFFAKNAACIVQRLDCDLSPFIAGRVERGLDTGQAKGAAKDDLVIIGMNR